jgi:ABC-2 type transport system ATP-binding protein
MQPDRLDSSRTAICVRDVAKRFGETSALDRVSLELGERERVGLLGPNGAGKTTLVRCITGSARPDAGEIRMFGARLPPRGGRRQLGFVPQELAIYPDLTARENLQAFGRFHGLSAREARNAVDWALEWTGLSERAGDLTKTFSGGMKRRINIACGVLHRPRAIVLDEPTVGVDPQSRERIFVMLDELHRDGASILLTTHQLDEAEQRCDRIVILDHGRVVAEGTLQELIKATVGVNRRVKFKLADAAPRLPGFEIGVDPQQLVAEVGDLSVELPDMLARIQAAGGKIRDVEVRAPSLHAVFLHLTGRELRQ